ncbi:hypothetical protein [Dyadobacter sp. 676]|uniref:Uncharacterized protein n=1 Tax=Dyadobacter sp. 676 TaxID=3088362 RepID=A0AAU8FPH2_9BACT
MKKVFQINLYRASRRLMLSAGALLMATFSAKADNAPPRLSHRRPLGYFRGREWQNVTVLAGSASFGP